MFSSDCNSSTVVRSSVMCSEFLSDIDTSYCAVGEVFLCSRVEIEENTEKSNSPWRASVESDRRPRAFFGVRNRDGTVGVDTVYALLRVVSVCSQYNGSSFSLIDRGRRPGDSKCGSTVSLSVS